MTIKAIAVFTYKSKESIFRVGGTSSWVVNRAHARQYDYVVCTRNANFPLVEGPEAHGEGFLVGRISDIVPVTQAIDPEAKPGRWMIAISEYADISIPNLWKGRNPLQYTTLEDLGIDVNTLDFKPVPKSQEIPLSSPEAVSFHEDQDFKLTIAEAKQGLANTFGVSPDSIEITIRG